MKSNEYRKIAGFCSENWKAQAQKVISVADNVCNNDFLFDMPWDLERTEETVHFDNDIDWNYRLNGDPEFVYQLNRHTFLLHLGESYYLTGEDKYAEKFCSLLEDWIDRVPRNKENSLPWRSLETGLRLACWTQAIPMVSETEYYTESLDKKVRDCIKVHIDELMEARALGQICGNWGIFQDRGMFRGAEFTCDRKHMDIAVKKLCEEVAYQVSGDGMHRENSAFYHNCVLMYLLDVICIAEKINYRLPEEITEAAEKMAEVTLGLVKPTGCDPLLGDGDNNDIRDLLCRSAVAFGDGRFKSAAYDVLDFDSAWFYGMDAVEKYGNIKAETPDELNSFYTESGNFAVRSAWDKNANYLFFRNGRFGGGHSHSDKLHIELDINGEDILVDGGRYTYKEDKMRIALKEPCNHNTVTADDIFSPHPYASWGTDNLSRSFSYAPAENENCVLVGGCHLGYVELNGVVPERQVLYIKPDIFIVYDVFRGRGEHKYKQYFNFSPEGSVSADKNTAVFESAKTICKLCFLRNDAKLSVENSHISYNYNALTENKRVVSEINGCDTVTAVTVICGASKDTFRDFKCEYIKIDDRPEADNVVITVPGHQYTVAICREDIEPYYLNGKIFAGRVMVYRDNDMIFRTW